MQRFWIALAALACGCNSLDAPGPGGDSAVVVPTDVRAAAQPLHAPPPISGGTLAVTPDGMIAVAADPDRDRVSVVALDTFQVRHVALEAGDEPGRVLAADGGRAYVALRRAGALAVIDLRAGSLAQRVPVCASPRGLALDVGAGLLHVACAEGRLVSLRSERGSLVAEPARDLALGEDVRDVLVRGDELWVSTFKRAQLLRLDASGALVGRIGPTAQASVESFGARPPLAIAMLEPRLAYRTLQDASGQIIVLHQLASQAEIEVDKRPDGLNSSAYGGGFGCGGIVSRALTSVDAQGNVVTRPVASGVLSVDMALDSHGDQLAIVNAGEQDDAAPRPTVVFDTDADFSVAPTTVRAPSAAGSINTVPRGLDLSAARQSRLSLVTMPWQAGCQFVNSLAVPGQATAIVTRKRAAGTRDDLLVQSREPALLSIVSQPSAGNGAQTTVVGLGGDSVLDTGHELFHRDSGAGIACASCHPEGAEDGHVWHFNTVGARRTQALHVGLEGTAPFHWNGEERDLGHLMEDVFVGRMGGVHQSPERMSALQRWLFSLQPPAAGAARDADAVQRGEQLFASPDVGCRRCHSGDKLTDNHSVDVGTGAVLQVPSLRALAYRAPFMHDGCATTLRERFQPGCGGAKHGDVSGLTEPQVDDLIAYLQTL
jgi:mono/diheme cytochrome c family protein